MSLRKVRDASRTVRAMGRKQKFQRTRCVMRSLYDRVPGVCNGLKWVKENQERGKHKAHLKGQVHERASQAAYGGCGKSANLDMV